MNAKYFSILFTVLAAGSVGCSGVDGGPDGIAAEEVGEASAPLIISQNAICGRGFDGIHCGLSTGSSFGPANAWQPAATAFSDANGWNLGPQYYSTIGFPDVNGDGVSDVCGRGGGGINCALSTGTSFGAASVWAPLFSDAGGWNADPKYYSTIQYADLNADGKADVCGRGALGMWCALSTGTSFASASQWQTAFTAFSDSNGWNSVASYSTIRLADVNGDGKADACGRGSLGMYCALSTGTSFNAAALWQTAATAFSDANGWNTGAQYYSTIRFADLNGDGKADVCGRGGSGVNCALSTGSGFGAAAVWQPAATAFSDVNGWNTGAQYYSTIQFADLNGDGKADVCGRGGSGMSCALSTGSSFGAAPVWQSAFTAFSDANGWNAVTSYSTIRLSDVNADGKADVCGRGGLGMNCALSNGTSFTAASLWQSAATAFSDANGWNSGAQYYSTIRFAPQH